MTNINTVFDAKAKASTCIWEKSGLSSWARTQSGRTLTEVLGVIVIISLLTFGGIMLYTWNSSLFGLRLH